MQRKRSLEKDADNIYKGVHNQQIDCIVRAVPEAGLCCAACLGLGSSSGKDAIYLGGGASSFLLLVKTSFE